MRDQLAEQRRQLAEIERIRSLAGAGSLSGTGSRSTSTGTRSHAVMPPSGAERPANHLQVNKIAQVINLIIHFLLFYFFIKTKHISGFTKQRPDLFKMLFNQSI